MQYIGLGDLLSGFINRIPDYAVRFGSFLLNTVRRFVLNPWGFVTMLVGAVIAIDLLDEAIVNITNTFQNGVKLIQNSLINWINSITPSSCGFGDIMCYIESGLLSFAKTLLSSIFTYIINPLLSVVEFILNSVNYTAKTIFYSISSFLCNFVTKYYGIITGAYASYRALRWIGPAIVSGLARGKFLLSIFSGVLAPFITYLVASSIANMLLNFILSQFGVSCSTLTPPSVTSTKLPTISTTAVQSASTSATYSLTSKASGSPPQVGYIKAKYSFNEVTTSTLSPIAYIDASYAFTQATRLPVSESITVNTKYGFSAVPPAFFTILVTGSEAYSVAGIITIVASLTVAAGYTFRLLTGPGIGSSIPVSVSYSLTAQNLGYPGVTAGGSGTTLYYYVAPSDQFPYTVEGALVYYVNPNDAYTG